jgi:hypothetical protein
MIHDLPAPPSIVPCETTKLLGTLLMIYCHIKVHMDL